MYCIKLVVSLGLCYILIDNFMTKGVELLFFNIHWASILLSAFILCSLPIMIAGKVWIIIERRIGVSSLLLSNLIAAFLNQMLLPIVAGDAYRVRHLFLGGLSLREAFFAIFFERASSVFALCALVFFCLNVFNFDQFYIVDFVSGLCFAVIMASLSLYYYYDIVLTSLTSFFKAANVTIERMFGRKLNFENFKPTSHGPKRFRDDILVVAISIIGQLIPCFSAAVVAVHYPLEVSNFILFTIIPISLFLSLIPISIGGLGIREGAITFLLIQNGSEADVALEFSFAFTISIYLSTLPGLIFFILRKS